MRKYEVTTLLGAVVIATASLCASQALAQISLGQLDDFQDATTMGWRAEQDGYNVPRNVANAGPQGFGDWALYSRSGDAQPPGKLVIINGDAAGANPGPGNWRGDWTAAGITQILMDVRNPATLPGADALTIRLGIAGPGTISAFGNNYVTHGLAVPPDNAWRTLVFNVPGDFAPVGSGADLAAALRGVQQFRILHNPAREFKGVDGPAEFFVDNIHAMGPVPGDYNGNGAVDAADYVVWRNLDGQSGMGIAADGTGPSGVPDGLVNSLDYDFWRARFGANSDGGHHHGASLSLAAVPEPATGLLGSVGVLLFFAACREIGNRKEPAN